MAALSGKCHAVVEWEPESGFKSHAVTVCSCAGLPARLTLPYLYRFVFVTMDCLLALSLGCVFFPRTKIYPGFLFIARIYMFVT